ncbi:MAG: PhoH family protein [Planctomycetaceae bacterium]|jgi:phosphate starvation-inducible PhoH-like protein
MHDTLTFADPAHIPLLFGAQDRYLKLIREALGVGVTIRGDTLRLHGTEEQIRLGLGVFEQLRVVLQQRGELHEAEVRGVLGQVVGGGVARRVTPTPRPAGAPLAPSSPGGHLPPMSNTSASNSLVTSESIDLLEKARRVLPRSPGQSDYVRAIRDHDLVFCEGPAGSGKTYLAVAMAVNALRQEQVRKIVLVRPAVEAGEKLGFLPGDMLAKINPFLRPLLDALSEMLDYEQVRRYIERDVVEIVPLAFMRGRTLNETFIILDEGQNTTVTQMKMFLTRLGDGSRIVVTGDSTQTDLPPEVTSGFGDALRRLSGVPGIASVRLTGRDIVRHPLVKKIVEAYDDGPPAPRHRGASA